jgi:hypothetical protein
MFMPKKYIFNFKKFRSKATSMDTVLLQRFLVLMGCAIFFTFITVSLANQQAANACNKMLLVTADGKCKPPVKVIEKCTVKKLRK